MSSDSIHASGIVWRLREGFFFVKNLADYTGEGFPAFRKNRIVVKVMNIAVANSIIQNLESLFEISTKAFPYA